MDKTQQERRNSKTRGHSPDVVRNEHRAAGTRYKLHIALLLTISLVLGAYIIATTVLMTQDGALYIRTAQNFGQNPIGTIKSELPVGYPFLIFISHAVTTFFSQSSSVYGWLYCAQGISLLCRVLSLVPLYFIGKLLELRIRLEGSVLGQRF